MSISKQDICDLIPHAGKMCLLDVVEGWDELSITCLSRTHRDSDNPLRDKDGLPMEVLVEYGAQAMAVHGNLVPGSADDRIKEGYLASLRDLSLAQGCLSDIDEDLTIRAERIHAAGGSMVYQFSVYAGIQELASGRATVVGISAQGGK